MLEEKIDIKKLIYEIRGKQVMLDSDLAKLYQVETKRINEAVKNNIDKFPDRYAFKITLEEYNNLRSKISTSSLNNNYGGRRYRPYVFTEQGVAMLATILKSKIAIQVSINIMDAFVEMRKYIASNLLEQKYFNNLVLEHDEDIKLLKEVFDNFKEEREYIFFKGETYDSYSKIIDIFKLAKKNLIIIDSYADKTALDIISKLRINVTLICNNSDRLSKTDLDKYREQYNNLTLIRNNTFHDRYFIFDKKDIYHSGTSINNVGDKVFSINLLQDDFVKKSLIDYVDLICKN